MEEKEEQIKSKNRKWIKWLIGIIIILVIIITILLPPVFSRLILRPAIEEGFRQATSEQYQIQFKNLKWSLLGRSLEISDIDVGPEFDIHDSSDYIHLKLSKLKFDKIRYTKLLSGDINFKKLNLDGLIIYNHHFSIDTFKTAENQYLGKINSIFIQEVDLQIDSILVFEHNDSSFLLTKGDIQINHLNWDSISFKSRFNWPIVKHMYSSFGYLSYQLEQNHIQLKNFKISEKRLKHFSALFESIQIDDLKNQNSYSFIWPSITIDSVRRTLEDSVWKFSSKGLSLVNDSLFIDQNKSSNINPEKLIDSFKKKIENLGIEINIDKIESKNKYFYLKTAKSISNYKNAGINLMHFKLSKDIMKADDYRAFIGKTNLNQSFGTIAFDGLDLINRNLIFKNLSIVPSDERFSFYTRTLDLKQINWKQYLKNQAIDLKELSILEPNIKRSKTKSDTDLKMQMPIDVSLDRLIVSNGHLEWLPLNIWVDSFDLQIDSIGGSKNHIIKWDSLFRDLQFESDRLIVGQERSKFYIQLFNNKWNSQSGTVQSEILKMSHLNEVDSLNLTSKNFIINGFDWKSYLKNSNQIYLDNLSIDQLKIAGNYFSPSYENDSSHQIPNLIIQHFKIPDLQININFNQNRSLYCENLEINSDSLVFSELQKPPINFAQLSINSKNTVFSKKQDSLLLKLKDWTYNSKNNKWQLDQVYFTQIYKDDNIKSHSTTSLNTPSVKISGLNPFDYLIDRKIGLDSLMIHQANFKFSGERYREVKEKNTLNWQQELRTLVEKYVSIDLKYIQIDNSSLDLKNNYLGRRDDINIQNIDVLVRKFYLDYQKINDWNRIFFSDSFEISFKKYFHSINNGNYLFDIKHGSLQSDSRVLKLSNISFLSLSDQSAIPINFQIKDLVCKDFYLNATSYLPEFEMGDLSFLEPHIQLKEFEKSNQNMKSFQVDSINLYPAFKDYLNAIEIKKLSLINGDFDLKTDDESYNLDGIGLNLTNIRIDSTNKNFTDSKFLYANNLRLIIPRFSWISRNRLYEYGFRNMIFNSTGKEIELDSLYVRSRYDRRTFAANLNYQKEQIDAIFPKIKLLEIDLRDAIFRERFKAKKLDIYNPEILIFKDKTIIADKSAYKMMPADQLLKLGFYLDIDTAKVYNGFVQYEERANFMDQPGKVFFNHLNLNLTGLSNDKDFREFGGTLRILASAKMMGKSDVNVTAVFPLNSIKQEFIALASMNQLDAVDLNPLIQPLTLLSAKQGNLRHMQMNVQGNNDYVYGEMLLKYNNLKVEVMNKKLKESGLATLLANSFVIRKNNKNYFFPRKGPIYFERVKYRSFIHYLAHSAIVGAKTSLGIDKRKTQRKIDDIQEKQNK